MELPGTFSVSRCPGCSGDPRPGDSPGSRFPVAPRIRGTPLALRSKPEPHSTAPEEPRQSSQCWPSRQSLCETKAKMERGDGEGGREKHTEAETRRDTLLFSLSLIHECYLLMENPLCVQYAPPIIQHRPHAVSINPLVPTHS